MSSPDTPSSSPIPSRTSSFSRLAMKMILGASISQGCAHTPPTLDQDYTELSQKYKKLSKDLRELIRDYKSIGQQCEESAKETASLREKLARVNSLDRLEQTVVGGNPEVGTVVHIRVLHPHPFGKQSNKERMNVVNYQWRVLEELITLNPSAIFLENVVYEGTDKRLVCYEGTDKRPKYPEKSSDKEIDCIYNRIMKTDPQAELVISQIRENKKIDDLPGTEAGLILADMLNEFGAGFTYSWIQADDNRFEALPSASLATVNKLTDIGSQLIDKEYALERLNHRGLSAEQSDSLEKKLEEEIKALVKEFALWDKQREKELSEQVMTYLETHPGETVAVTYGAAHNFCDDFSALEKPPVVNEISYPNLISKGGLVSWLRSCNFMTWDEYLDE